MRFDLTDLRLFVQVSETCSITRGAAQTHMSLASASARIRGMETTLGLPLLKRGPRGVSPTPAGQALLRHAGDASATRADARRAREFRARLQGAHQAAVEHACGHRIPARSAGNLPCVSPNVDIELEERNSSEIVSAVSERYADAGIVVDIGDHGDLQTFPFAVDRLVLITPRAHPLGKKRRLSFKDILDQEFVGLGAGRALQEFLSRQAARAGSTLKLRVHMTSFDAICQMVEYGAGIAVIPERAARGYRKHAINIVGLTDEWAIRRLLICVREIDELSGHAKHLVEHLRAR